MNAECSSGCESGWTIYLDNSFLSHPPFIGAQDEDDDDDDGDNEFYDEQDKYIKSKSDQKDDWSMVSDASSGPPHFPQHESYNNFNAQQDINGGCFYSASKAASKTIIINKKKQHLQDKQQQQQHLPSFLDDTASSPLFDFSMKDISVSNQQISIESMLDYSQGFSATYFEGRLSLHDHFGFLEPSLSENEVHSNKSH